MSNYQYTADLLADILFRARSGAMSDWGTQALVYLNRAYQSLWDGGLEFSPTAQIDWEWLQKYPPGNLVLSPAITTGTVSVTNGVVGITFSSAPAVSVEGYHFKVDQHADVFRILVHTAGSTSATLDSVYTGATGAALAYRLMKLEYDLASDVLRVMSPMRPSRLSGTLSEQALIHIIDDTAMDVAYPVSLVDAGLPTYGAMVGETKIRFNKYGGQTATELYRIEYDYLYKPDLLTSPGTTEQPVVPWQYRKVLADMALYYIHVDKNDNRAESSFALAKAGIEAMIRQYWYRRHVGDVHYGAIRPRQAQLRQRVLRSESGRLL